MKEIALLTSIDWSTLSERLKKIKHVVLDMDGTIYHENTLISGAKSFFELLRKQGKNYVFMTNNSSKNKYSYVEKLIQLGIHATVDNIVSSVNVTIDFLNSHKPKAKIFLVGTKSFQEELEAEGFTVVSPFYRKMDIDYVLVGFDTELNYAKVEGACYFISRGVEYIATNCDIRCPVKEGKYIPDCGAICQLISAATDCHPLFLGKPNEYIVHTVMSKCNVKKEDIICIGDRLYTDIAVGIKAGVDTAVVLTGETTKEDLVDTIFQPTYCFQSIKDIYQLLLERGSFNKL